MPIHKRKLKVIEFEVEGTNFESQVSEWKLENGTDDGDPIYTFAPDGEDREDVEPEWQLNLTFFSDWRSEGISDFFMLHDGETVNFTIDHHPDIVGEHVRWVGKCVIKAPDVGGEARENETQESEFMCVGRPVYSRPTGTSSTSSTSSGTGTQTSSGGGQA